MKGYTFNIKKFARSMFIVAASIALLTLIVDFIRFPECYSTTMKYQLQNDIEQGDQMAIEYYESTYIANGRKLFD